MNLARPCNVFVFIVIIGSWAHSGISFINRFGECTTHADIGESSGPFA